MQRGRSIRTPVQSSKLGDGQSAARQWTVYADTRQVRVKREADPREVLIGSAASTGTAQFILRGGESFHLVH